MNLEIVQPSHVELDTSTITTERSKDDMRLYMKEIVVNYFKKSGIKVGTAQEFEVMWKTEVEKEETQDVMQMPCLTDASEVRIEPIVNTNHQLTSVFEDNASEIEVEEEYDGVSDCKNCEMVLENCETHNQASLETEYGTRMKCIEAKCGKTLLACLNDGPMGTRGAYVCKNCKAHECRHMRCVVCHFNQSGNIRETRTRRSTL